MTRLFQQDPGTNIVMYHEIANRERERKNRELSRRKQHKIPWR